MRWSQSTLHLLCRVDYQLRISTGFGWTEDQRRLGAPGHGGARRARPTLSCRSLVLDGGQTCKKGKSRAPPPRTSLEPRSELPYPGRSGGRVGAACSGRSGGRVGRRRGCAARTRSTRRSALDRPTRLQLLRLCLVELLTGSPGRRPHRVAALMACRPHARGPHALTGGGSAASRAHGSAHAISHRAVWRLDLGTTASGGRAKCRVTRPRRWTRRRSLSGLSTGSRQPPDEGGSAFI